MDKMSRNEREKEEKMVGRKRKEEAREKGREADMGVSEKRSADNELKKVKNGGGRERKEEGSEIERSWSELMVKEENKK